MSQNTIRDALRLLEQEGWVVKNRAARRLRARFSADDAAEVCALIAAVEPLALRLGDERIDKALRADLRGRIAAARQAAYANERAGRRSSICCGFTSGSARRRSKPLTAQLLETLYNQVRLLEALRQARAPRSAQELDGQIKAHETLLRRISAGDVDGAYEQMVTVIVRYGAEIVAAMGS